MISRHAIVETEALDEGVTVGEFAVVRKGAVLGRGVVVHPHVVIEAGVSLDAHVEVFPGAYLGKIPKGAGALARPPVFDPVVRIAAGCSIGPGAVIYYDVEIGEGSLIGDAASIREGCRIGARTVIGRHVTLNYAVIVGDRTKVMDHSWLAGNMRIGHQVFISGGVLTANDRHVGRAGADDAQLRGPTIEDEAVIGVGAILLPEITIGRGATVAAGALCSRDVAPGALVKGIPARAVLAEPSPDGER